MLGPIERWRVGKALAGDTREAERIVREHYPAVLRLLRHLTGRHDEAQDLAQRTFVQAHRALPRFRFDCPLRNWLLRIAVREYLHWRRDHHLSEPIDERLSMPPSDSDAIAVREAVAKLPIDLREPFLLRNVEGLTTSETAELLGIPEGTVKSRCHTARQRLRNALTDHAQPPIHPQGALHEKP